jgi:hypothetical protein
MIHNLFNLRAGYVRLGRSRIPLVDLPRMRQAEGEVRMSVFALSVASRKKPIAVCITHHILYTFILYYMRYVTKYPVTKKQICTLRTQRWLFVLLLFLQIEGYHLVKKRQDVVPIPSKAHSSIPISRKKEFYQF